MADPVMRAIGTLDVVIGLFGMLLNGLMLYGRRRQHGDADDRYGLQHTSQRQFFAEEGMQLADAEADRRSNIFILLDLSFNLLLAASLDLLGIATLRMARWVRRAGGASCIAWLVFIWIVEPVDFDELGLLIFLYPVVLLYLFTSREWKIAFDS